MIQLIPVEMDNLSADSALNREELYCGWNSTPTPGLKLGSRLNEHQRRFNRKANLQCTVKMNWFLLYIACVRKGSFRGGPMIQLIPVEMDNLSADSAPNREELYCGWSSTPTPGLKLGSPTE